MLYIFQAYIFIIISLLVYEKKKLIIYLYNLKILN